MIRQRQNLTLKVHEHSALGQVTVDCSNGMGFSFFEMKNFTIIGLGFQNCGAPIPGSLYGEARDTHTRTYYYFFEGTKTALFIVNIFNLVIDGLHVNNSDMLSTCLPGSAWFNVVHSDNVPVLFSVH